MYIKTNNKLVKQKEFNLRIFERQKFALKNQTKEKKTRNIERKKFQDRKNGCFNRSFADGLADGSRVKHKRKKS